MNSIFAQTERLILREMSEADFLDIEEMMKNPNVMYAWEYIFDDLEPDIAGCRTDCINARYY